MRIALLLMALAGAAGAQDFSGGVKVAGPQAEARTEANAALEARDWAKAARVLGPLAEATPKDARLLYDLGSAQDELDQAAAAEASYRHSIADDPKLMEPRVALGLLLARGGKLADAREEMAYASVIDGGDKELRARALRTLARLDAKTRPADARDELLEALKISPETTEDTLLTAELTAAAGNGAGAAEAAYRRVLLEKPDDAEATSGLAKLLVAQKHAAEAELYLLKALKAHPGDVGLTVQLASTYAAEGKPALAVPLVESLAAADPRDANARRLLAGLYVDAEQWAKAEPLLVAIVAADGRDTRSADDLGRTLVHLGRYAEAEVVLARIVAQPELFPAPSALAEAAGHLAFAASENMDPKAALRAVAVHATVSANPPALLFVAAISYDRLHQAKAAVQAYREFLAVSDGANPDQEFDARHRIAALEPMK